MPINPLCHLTMVNCELTIVLLYIILQVSTLLTLGRLGRSYSWLRGRGSSLQLEIPKISVICLVEGPGGEATGPGRAQAGHTLANCATRVGAPRGGAASAMPPTPGESRIKERNRIILGNKIRWDFLY
jgi:hypothetical protein